MGFQHSGYGSAMGRTLPQGGFGVGKFSGKAGRHHGQNTYRLRDYLERTYISQSEKRI